MLLRSDSHLGCLGSVSPVLATSGGSAHRELLPLRDQQRKQERPLSDSIAVASPFVRPSTVRSVRRV